MKMNWIIYSIIVAISFAIVVLIYKKLLLLGINQNLLNFFMFGLVFLGFTSMIIVNKTPIKLSYLMILLLIIASIFALIANYLEVKAFDSAPNPGYVATLISTQIILISVLSVLFFKLDFSWVKFLGMIIVLFGSYLIAR